MANELPRMDEHTPHGDPLKPRREQAEGAEPMPGELRSELDQLEQQPIEQVGPPGAGSPEASGEGTTTGSTGAAKLQGEDEGPTAEGGGGLETAGGGGY